MSTLTKTLIPAAQRQTAEDMHNSLDLSRGDKVSKRSGFLIMLTLSGVIAVAGVLQDSTATVIGAMIIAPLATPILGIALGIVTGRRSLVGRSILWVLFGLGIVVFIGYSFSALLSVPVSITTNSQISGRTSPQLLDLITALATGTAGAFAMCRRDLSAVLPGVAISISLVPPLGVVGVCAGQGHWGAALGALFLFLSNVVALVISGSIVFTLAGYARDPGSSKTANRRRAYWVVAILTAIIVLPLAANTLYVSLLAHWASRIGVATDTWLKDTDQVEFVDVDWQGLTAIVNVRSADGKIPPTTELRTLMDSDVPAIIPVTVDVTVGADYPVE
ncbi:TIGR00341 family protein (plasmid) [Coraliomargarita sp. W4R53]